MKTLILSLLFIMSLNAQTYFYTFNELNGIEDNSGNTHLFYRLYTFQKGGGPLGDYYENSIYHFDLTNGTDTLFLFDGGRIGDAVIRIIDLEFWNNNPSEYIYLGEGVSVDPVAFIQRFDQTEPSYNELGEAFSLEIGKEDDSLVIATAPFLVKSTDGGFNWTAYLGDQNYLKVISISPFSDNEIFFNNGWELLKTTDGGQNLYLVDTNHSVIQFFYDKDSIYI